ncbi:MAG: DeoR family transcriptional regulator, partial [Olsenella sp.]|nr:DeoR family transcriptional regulator [Olsenella sp.]
RRNAHGPYRTARGALSHPAERGVVTLALLAEHFGFSTMTVRRDLRCFEHQGLANISHGSARKVRWRLFGSLRAPRGLRRRRHRRRRRRRRPLGGALPVSQSDARPNRVKPG